MLAAAKGALMAAPAAAIWEEMIARVAELAPGYVAVGFVVPLERHWVNWESAYMHRAPSVLLLGAALLMLAAHKRFPAGLS